MLKIFKSGSKTLTSDVETWVVRWNIVYQDFMMLKERETAQFFTDEHEAREFANSLKKSLKLLGYRSSTLSDINVLKVKNGLNE